MQFVKYVCWILEAIRRSRQNTWCTNRLRMQSWRHYTLLTEKKFSANNQYVFFSLIVIMLQFCETFKQLTPGHRLIIYSYSSADKNSAFSESHMIHARSKCKNRVEMLYLRICGVMSIDFEINLVISIWCSLGRYSTPWLEVCSMKTEIMQFDKYVC